MSKGDGHGKPLAAADFDIASASMLILGSKKHLLQRQKLQDEEQFKGTADYHGHPLSSLSFYNLPLSWPGSRVGSCTRVFESKMAQCFRQVPRNALRKKKSNVRFFFPPVYLFPGFVN